MQQRRRQPFSRRSCRASRRQQVGSRPLIPQRRPPTSPPRSSNEYLPIQAPMSRNHLLLRLYLLRSYHPVRQPRWRHRRLRGPNQAIQANRWTVRIINKSVLRDQTHGELVYRPLEFQKRSQLVIGMHNEALSVIAMSVDNPDRPPVAINY